MSTLRGKVQAAIESTSDSELAAIRACLVLENEIGLAGNGWFDDDEEMQNRLGGDDESDEYAKGRPDWAVEFARIPQKDGTTRVLGADDNWKSYEWVE